MYKRILLKLSGEALAPVDGKGTLDSKCLSNIGRVIKELHDEGVQIGVVIGGGNIWRGKLAGELGIERVPADFMGMLGTVINALALCNTVKALGVPSITFSAVGEIPGICEAYNVNRSLEELDKNVVCFFAGGVGKPYFSTDTGATTRALENKCEVILMAKHGVDGIYDKDPLKYSDAKFFKDITYKQVIDMQLGVMDIPAVELVKDSQLQLRVFNMENVDNILKVVHGEDIGTTVRR